LSKSDAPQRGKNWRRAELALYRRCRRGVPDALRSLLYRSGDYWYTTALMVCGDEQAACEAVVATWHKLLSKLAEWRFAGGLQRRAENILLNGCLLYTSPSPRD